MLHPVTPKTENTFWGLNVAFGGFPFGTPPACASLQQALAAHWPCVFSLAQGIAPKMLGGGYEMPTMGGFVVWIC